MRASLTLNTVGTVLIVVAALYVGREILMPIAVAVLLSFVLAPLVRLLQRLRIPRFAAVMLVVAVALGFLTGVATLMFTQARQLASDLPHYQITLSDKVKDLRELMSATGPLERAAKVFRNLQKELDRPRDEDQPPLSKQEPSEEVEKPLPVELRQPAPSALQALAIYISPLLHPLATAGIILIFVIFILLQQQDLRNRLIRLAGPSDLQRTTVAMDEAGQRLSRLFLTQVALNTSFGVVVACGLWLIGVPSALLWGILAALLRFVPYIGAIIAALLPITVAAAVEPGWSMMFMTAALFIVVEPIIGHFVEPLVYGHSSGLSPIAVILAATFWTWIWGPVGLLLATPLTTCLVVLGRHVETLQFLEIILGDRPALSPSEAAYQRMLVGDAVEMSERAYGCIDEISLTAFYDDILLKGLSLAWVDSQRGHLDRQQMQRIKETISELVDDLEDHENISSVAPDAGDTGPTVVCIPGLDPLDEAAALLLSQNLRRRGISSMAEDVDVLSLAKLASFGATEHTLVCLCYLERASTAQVKYACRRIRRQAPTAPILITVLTATADRTHGEGPSGPSGADVIEGTFKAASSVVAQQATQLTAANRNITSSTTKK